MLHQIENANKDFFLKEPNGSSTVEKGQLKIRIHGRISTVYSWHFNNVGEMKANPLHIQLQLALCLHRFPTVELTLEQDRI